MQTILFDTSVLVAGFVAAHPKHHQAYLWLKRALANEFTLAVSTHSIAECYGVLTRLPLSPKLSPAVAKRLIEENVGKTANLVTLTHADYLTVIKDTAALGLTGGIIYDALIFRAAKKIKAQHILTFNQRDFHRLAQEDTGYIISP